MDGGTEALAADGSSRSGLSLVVAVPTFHRPERLSELLPLVGAGLAELRMQGAVGATRIIVVDNDPAESARTVVRGDYDGSPARYDIEQQPGIPAVRNRAIDESAADRLLVFIDDDEIPSAGWLSSLVTTWERCGRPAAVMGRVESVLADEVDPWVVASGAFRRPQMPSGTVIDVAATGNLLLDLDQVRASGVRFDGRIGLGGGSDTLFSRAFAVTGARFVWCNESVTTDTVEPERQTRDWVRRRSFSHGNIKVLVDLYLERRRSRRMIIRVRGALGGAARLGYGLVRSGAGVVAGSTHHRARGRRFVQRGAGMMAASIGRAYAAYGRGASQADPSKTSPLGPSQ